MGWPLARLNDNFRKVAAVKSKQQAEEQAKWHALGEAYDDDDKSVH